MLLAFSLAGGISAGFDDDQASTNTSSPAKQGKPPSIKGKAVAVKHCSCDIDGNGVIDAADVRRMVDQVLGKHKTACDVNGDGKADVLDVQLVTAAIGSGQCNGEPLKK